MQRKKLLAVLGLAAMLVTAGCTGALGSTNALAPTTNDGSTIGVSADGTAEADPDRALVRIAVEATADDAETARERLAENVSRMRTALSELGIADDRIRTVQYDLREEHRKDRPEKPGSDEERTYRAVHAFEITVTDLDSVGTVIDTAVKNGATRVDGVQFTLSEETRRELYNEALREAMTNARSQADTLAESGDLRISGVHSIQAGSVNYRPYYAETAMSAGGKADTSIESGPVSVTAQVQVTYNATAR